MDSNGQNIINVASNVAPDLKVVLVGNNDEWLNASSGQPFSNSRTPQPVQVMSSKASKARYATN